MNYFYNALYPENVRDITEKKIRNAIKIILEGLNYYIKAMEKKKIKIAYEGVYRIDIRCKQGALYECLNSDGIIYNIICDNNINSSEKIYLKANNNEKVALDPKEYKIKGSILEIYKDVDKNIYNKVNIEGDDYNIEFKDNINNEIEKVKITKNIYFIPNKEKTNIKKSEYKKIDSYALLDKVPAIKTEFVNKEYNKDYNKENKLDISNNVLSTLTLNKEKNIIIEFIKKPFIRLDKKDKNKESEDTIDELTKLLEDNNIEIQDNKNNIYEVKVIDKDEHIVTLKKDKKEVSYNILQKDDISHFELTINTGNYKKQRRALRQLQEKPYYHLKNLLKIFEDKDKVKFDRKKEYGKIEDLAFINPSFKGADEQIQFVKTALETPDFAFLTGPPGSGKTTAIIELICQLRKQNKRILLCGSTHVAIDNVLERLDKEHLIDKYKILPLRIGLANRISEAINKYSIEEQEKEYNLKGLHKDILYDAANFVCGTTMGILQYPPFKESIYDGNKYIRENMLFDYLIIDESSKTTFQEFIVPAFYAKKWILVGDIRQLSPYIEQNFITEVIDNIGKTDNKKNNKKDEIKDEIKDEEKNVCMYLEESSNNNIKRDLTKINIKTIVFCISDEEMSALSKEYNIRINDDKYRNQYKNIYIINNNKFDLKQMFQATVIFITKKYIKYIPASFYILNCEEKSRDFIKHTYRYNKYNYDGIGKNELQQYIDKIKDCNITNKSWAREIAWRIDRENQLRVFDKEIDKVKQKKIESYKNTIEAYLPLNKRDKIIEMIDQYASILLPSILELLEKGAVVRKSKTEYVISKGFKKEDFDKRHHKLTFQHRMHSEISEFPREKIYEGEALKNPDDIDKKREWSYKEYTHRTCWLDVDNGVDYRGSNQKEVDKIMIELGKFLEFAKKNPKPDGKPWEVGILSFYNGQIFKIRERLQEKTKQKNNRINFNFKNVDIKLSTVDQFQGDEKDIIFLSMVRTDRDGFLDSPYRLNVAITRARYQLVIIGKHNYFKGKDKSTTRTKLLQEFANQRFFND